MKSANTVPYLTPTRFLTQCNLSNALHFICMQHHNSLKKDNPEIPDLPNFVSESIHLICLDLAKIINNNSIDLDYWNSIENTSGLVRQILESYNTTKTTGDSNGQS